MRLHSARPTPLPGCSLPSSRRNTVKILSQFHSPFAGRCYKQKPRRAASGRKRHLLVGFALVVPAHLNCDLLLKGLQEREQSPFGEKMVLPIHQLRYLRVGVFSPGHSSFSVGVGVEPRRDLKHPAAEARTTCGSSPISETHSLGGRDLSRAGLQPRSLHINGLRVGFWRALNGLATGAFSPFCASYSADPMLLRNSGGKF